MGRPTTVREAMGVVETTGYRSRVYRRGVYLEVTYSKGRPLAAYVHLPRERRGRVARTEPAGNGLQIDYGSDGIPVGLEITVPTAITLDEVNAHLSQVGAPPLRVEDWTPLHRG
jgi:hypothetical protein